MEILQRIAQGFANANQTNGKQVLQPQVPSPSMQSPQQALQPQVPSPSMQSPQQAQGPGMFGGAQNFLRDRSGALTMAGAALMSGGFDQLPQGLMAGAQLDTSRRGERREQEAQQEQSNATIAALQRYNPEMSRQDAEQLVLSGQAGPVLSRALTPPTPQREPSQIQILNAMGIDPQSEEGRQFLLRGSNNVTVHNGPGDPQIGTIPQGYEVYNDPETNQRALRAIPGGEAYADQQASADQSALREEQDSRSAGIVLDEIGLARELIQNQTTLNPTTGFTGGIASAVSSTDAGALAGRLQTIKANIGFDRLQQMRMASPTGGTLGAVSEFENRLLQAVYGTLEQSGNREELLYNLDRLEQVYNQIIYKGISDEDAREQYRAIVRGDPAQQNSPQSSPFSTGADGVMEFRP